MPIPKEYREVCEMLLNATEDDRVIWVAEGGNVAVHLPDFSLVMWAGTDDQSNKGFVGMGLRAAKESREQIDNWYIEEGEEEFTLMTRLYGSARRYTGGVAQNLTVLRDLLNSGKRVGTPADELLIVHSASYGAKTQLTDVTDILRRRMVSGRIENFLVTNEAFGGDPIHGVPKVLTVEYSYMGRTRVASIAEGAMVSLPE
jgi:hypothetical protein